MRRSPLRRNFLVEELIRSHANLVISLLRQEFPLDDKLTPLTVEEADGILENLACMEEQKLAERLNL